MDFVSHRGITLILIDGSAIQFVCIGRLSVFTLSFDAFKSPHLALKRQEKNASEMSSVEVVCCKLPNFTYELSMEASSVDPEQTVPIGAV